MKKPIIVASFSAGETSAFMTQWLIKNMSDTHEIIVVFANTGEENLKTLDFADKCDKYFGFNMVWIESIFDPQKGKGVRAKVVNYESADRNGEVFESCVAKFGIPNIHSPQCSREMKKQTILSYLRDHLKLKKEDYKIAIGIRIDEVDRISSSYQKDGVIYPLLESKYCPMTKGQINHFFQYKMPFRLEIKGYEGNCKVCWKKSLRKLLTIAKNTPEHFDNFKRMEDKYENFQPRKKMGTPPFRFYRKNISVNQILEMSKSFFIEAEDDKMNFNKESQSQLWGYDLDNSNGCSESCESF